MPVDAKDIIFFHLTGTYTTTLIVLKVYEESRIDINNVNYVEAHGTGTIAGDPQEIIGISEAFLPNKRQTPLLVGSVKSNMGHSEGNSGMAGLIKVIIAMENGVIPANLHYKEPKSSLSALADGRLQVFVVDTNISLFYFKTDKY